MSFWTNFVDALLDALKDSAMILPFMFAAFVVIGLIERGAGKRMVSVILAAGKIGPLPGALLGVVPSCGFSAAASNLYGAGLITTGTLLAVYLSTSDEMLAVMVSSTSAAATPAFILKVLGVKVLSGIICGFAADGAVRLVYAIRRKSAEKAQKSDIETDADEEYNAEECCCTDGCCAAKGNLFLSALKRTLRTLAFIFVISLVLGVLFAYVDKAAVGAFMKKMPVLGCVISALLGLIPNCAVSVALTELYLEGVISVQMMLCGLMTGAGSGLLVLFHSNKNIIENAVFVLLLFISGLGMGSLAGALLF